MTTKELLALALAATPGPWQPMNDRDWDVLIGDIDGPDDGEMHYAAVAEIIDGSPRSRANAALIVAAVNSLPALCAEVEALQRQVGLLRETLGRAEEYLPMPPERNCSCHLSPPCCDCVDNSDLRDLHETIAPLIKEPK